MIKTYRHSGKYTNKSKIAKIFEVSKEYKEYFNSSISNSINNFYQVGKLPKYLPTYDKSDLSKRYRQTCGSQVKSTIESWLANIENRFIESVMKSSISQENKKQLLIINKYHLWFTKDLHLTGEKISIATLKLARRIFKQVRGQRPKMKRPSMLLDQKVASKEASNCKEFDYWIKLATLEKRKPIYLPVVTYPYYDKQEGTEKKSVQIIVHEQKKKISFGFIKDIPKKEDKKENVVGIDLGVVELINTSTGNKYGLTLYKLVQKYDKIIQNQIKGRMKAGYYQNSTHLENLYEKVRELIKNEVGRALNKLILSESPKTIVIENLMNLVKNLKKDRRLSKRMRRLLINSGISKVRERLKEKCQEHQIDLIEVNPAYTSMECHRCHNIDSRNRKGKKFHCKGCGKKCDADYNGSVNVSNRRSIAKISIYTPYREVKGIVEEFYTSKSQSSRQYASDREAMSQTNRSPPLVFRAELST